MSSQLPNDGGAATPDEAEQARQAMKDRDESAALVRASAAKWQGGLAALLGVITGVSITTIGDTIERIGEKAGTLLAFFVLAAFVVAVTASYFTLRASGGMPAVRRTRTRSSPHRTAVAALDDLRAGIGLTMVALALFGIAAMMIWFAEDEEAEPTTVRIDGTPAACGTLDLESSPGFALITETDHVVVVDLSTAPQWDVVTTCP